MLSVVAYFFFLHRLKVNTNKGKLDIVLNEGQSIHCFIKCLFPRF